MTALADVLAWQQRFLQRAAAVPPQDRGVVLEQLLEERMSGYRDAGVRCAHADVPGVDATWVTHGSYPAAHTVLYVHGGGFVGGGTRFDLPLLGRIARDAPARVLGVDYRLAPADPFPAAVDDVVAAYRWLLDQGVSARDVTLVCESAGATLGMLAAFALRDEGTPLPAGIALLSPFVDLTLSGESMREPSDADPMVTQESLGRGTQAFLGGRDPHELSPLQRDVAGLPPLHVQVGTGELLRDDARRLVSAVQATGGTAKLLEYAAMPHTWQGFPGLPQAILASDAIAAFVRGSAP